MKKWGKWKKMEEEETDITSFPELVDAIRHEREEGGGRREEGGGKQNGKMGVRTQGKGK